MGIINENGWKLTPQLFKPKIIMLISEYIWINIEYLSCEYIYQKYVIMRFSYNYQVPSHVFNEYKNSQYIWISFIPYYFSAFNEKNWGKYFSTGNISF